MKIDKLVEWNPWWSNEPFDELKGRHRPAYQHLIDSAGIKEITIITGVRRSGKSTLMYQMIDNLLKKEIKPSQILFLNFEDKKLTEDSLDDIYLSYRQNMNVNDKAYIFFDEIHRKDGWELWIRKKYDLKTNDKFVISGSSSYLLKKEYSTLLTGRNLTFDVFPLSFGEFLLFRDVRVNESNIKKGIVLEKAKIEIMHYLNQYITLGGFPEVSLKEKNYQIKLLEQYFDDILYKDIVDRYNLNSQKAKDLALFFMNNFTRLISLRSLRNSLGLSYDTIKDYLSYYKAAFLFFTLDHFSYSFKEQKTRASKVYCIDNGLRNAASFKFSKDQGKLIENLVFVELKRENKEVYYWMNNREVDFVVKNDDDTLSAINVTYENDVNDRELKALLEFKSEFKKTKELILLTKDIEKIEDKIRFIPLWKWLLT